MEREENERKIFAKKTGKRLEHQNGYFFYQKENVFTQLLMCLFAKQDSYKYCL